MEVAMRIDVEERIAAPAVVLYDLIADLGRMGEWSPENLGSEWVSGVPAQVGSRFSGRNRRGDAEWSGGGVIITAVPGRELAWTMGEDPANPRGTWRYTFESAGGGTRVVESYELGPAPSGFRDTLAGLSDAAAKQRLTAREDQLRAGMQTTLARLKAHAEALA
jgi:hypothetical protein